MLWTLQVDPPPVDLQELVAPEDDEPDHLQNQERADCSYRSVRCLLRFYQGLSAFSGLLVNSTARRDRSLTILGQTKDSLTSIFMSSGRRSYRKSLCSSWVGSFRASRRGHQAGMPLSYSPPKTLPGFIMPFGSAILFISRMNGSESPCSFCRCSIFPRPIPCSPVQVPPRSRA